MERKWSSPGLWSCRTRCRASEYVTGCDGKEASCLWHWLTVAVAVAEASEPQMQGRGMYEAQDYFLIHTDVPHTHSPHTRQVPQLTHFEKGVEAVQRNGGAGCRGAAKRARSSPRARAGGSGGLCVNECVYVRVLCGASAWGRGFRGCKSQERGGASRQVKCWSRSRGWLR